MKKIKYYLLDTKSGDAIYLFRVLVNNGIEYKGIKKSIRWPNDIMDWTTDWTPSTWKYKDVKKLCTKLESENDAFLEIL